MIPAFERAKTVHASDRAATLIGNWWKYVHYITGTEVQLATTHLEEAIRETVYRAEDVRICEELKSCLTVSQSAGTCHDYWILIYYVCVAMKAMWWAGSEILTAVTVKSNIFGDVKSSGSEEVHRRSGMNILPPSWGPKSKQIKYPGRKW
jgi:hypothetical protein